MSYEVPVERLRVNQAVEPLNIATSEELPAGRMIIGQERATRALQFGLGIRSPGFNVFVSGLPGTGRTTVVTRFVQETAVGKPVPSDWIYVNSFADTSRPNAIALPPGSARQFRSDMTSLLMAAQRELRKAFDSEEYAAKQQELDGAMHKEIDEIETRVNETARREQFVIQRSPVGIMTIPLRGGHPVTREEFMALRSDEQEEIAARQQALESEMEAALRQSERLKRRAAEQRDELDRQIALYALRQSFDILKEKYQSLPEVIGYLDEVQSDIVANLGDFKPRSGDEASAPPASPPAPKRPFRRYEVNVLVDNSALTGAPVVMEANPTYTNLFGRVENEAQFGTLVTDFTLIGRGSLHTANGGYLVLPAAELLTSALSWESLKRALKNRQISIEEPMQRLGILTTRTLQPEPIPLDLKVILIGQPALFRVLQAADEDFGELFKVRAEFDSVMDRTGASMHDYAVFVSNLCAAENLRHLDAAALATLMNHAARLAEDQTKLSTCFGEIADVIREASYYAGQEAATYTSAAHVGKAIDEKSYRSGLVQQRMQEMTERGALMIDVQGERVGQVNGLSVIDLGDFAFGHPNRITATIGLGREGLVDIEREAKLGGPIHTKGVLILAGYLTAKYAQDKPLGVSARLVFEQSYLGIEGDSASCAELYALLSELAGLPIRQGIAVTGSVSQKGDVQGIGGVNEKIEGFFSVCKAAGLTGDQGVLIPAANVRNLMLKDEVLAAAAAGQFHVWAVSTIDEGAEILMGVKAGARSADGTFEEGSINARVDGRLRELAERLSEFAKA